jgi:hypothetical protein
MPNGLPNRAQIDRFIVDEIDTVPQLEALLLIWRNRPRQWSSDEIARSLYVSPEVAASEINHLVHQGLLSQSADLPDHYVLDMETEGRQELLASLEEMHRHELVRISNLIHAKAPRSMRDFANAFRFKKEERK